MSAAALEWAARVAPTLRRPERLLVEALAARAGEDGYGQATTAQLEAATGYRGRGAVFKAAGSVGQLLRDAGGMLAWYPLDAGGYQYHYRVPPEAQGEGPGEEALPAGDRAAGGQGATRPGITVDAQVVIHVHVHRYGAEPERLDVDVVDPVDVDGARPFG